MKTCLYKLHGSVRGQDVYLIQSHTRPVHRNIMEMLIAIDCLKRDSAGAHYRRCALHGLFPKRQKRSAACAHFRPAAGRYD